MTRYDELTANMVDLSRHVAERLLADASPPNVAVAVDVIHKLSVMVEKQHETLARLMDVAERHRAPK